MDSYVTTTLYEFRFQSRRSKRLKQQVPTTRRRWLAKRDRWCQEEAYCGSQEFLFELRRSCEEFYSALKMKWGFNPRKLFLMK
jgi:hypothetical protein